MLNQPSLFSRESIKDAMKYSLFNNKWNQRRKYFTLGIFYQMNFTKSKTKGFQSKLEIKVMGRKISCWLETKNMKGISSKPKFYLT